MLFLASVSFFYFISQFLKTLRSDHLLALFFTVSPMQQSDLVWKSFQEKKCVTQLSLSQISVVPKIPGFCHTQYGLREDKERKAHCEFPALCAPLNPAPAPPGLAIFHSGVPLDPQWTGSQDQEKSWRIQERKEHSVGSSLVWAKGDTDSEGWGRKRKAEEQEGRGLSNQGQEYITELVVVRKLHFRVVLPKLCELGTRAELFVFPTLRATGTVSRACELSRGL